MAEQQPDKRVVKSRISGKDEGAQKLIHRSKSSVLSRPRVQRETAENGGMSQGAGRVSFRSTSVRDAAANRSVGHCEEGHQPQSQGHLGRHSGQDRQR